jgi:heme/copper-type cytochrome/quinol oxidase subunit 1
VNLATTVLLSRTEGLTLGRTPMFSWATLVASSATLVSGAVFLGGLLLLFLDQHFGGSPFFGVGTVGTQVIWQHTLWLYGRPDVYLLAVPALGAASDMVATAAGRPLANEDAARTAIAGVAFLSFGAWAAGTKVATAIVVPTYSVLTALIALPLGLLVLVWLDTLRRGTKRRPGVELAFVVGALLSWGGAGLAALVAGVKHVDGAAWSTGQVHLAMFAPPLLLGVGALHYWGPKIFGRALPAAAGGLAFLLLLGGSVVFAVGQYAAGYDHAGRFATISDSGVLVLAEVGGVLLGLGVLVVLATVARPSTASADEAARGHTLEWAAGSPPVAHNFDTIPEVRSSAPLADLLTAEAGTSRRCSPGSRSSRSSAAWSRRC